MYISTMLTSIQIYYLFLRCSKMHKSLNNCACSRPAFRTSWRSHSSTQVPIVLAVTKLDVHVHMPLLSMGGEEIFSNSFSFQATVIN